MARGVRIQELSTGDGPEAVRTSTVRIRYSGFLSRGEAFQSDVEMTIDLSQRDVIAGLRYGITGMREGGKRRIRISPHLGYGEHGIPGIIPPNAVLEFEIELLEVLPPHRRRA
jgi:FKBP-type peptidyl-prolyl cis-trans isomerase